MIAEYKNFICPYLDCEYILYDKAFNPSINHKIEPNQYNACIAITGATNGSSRKKNYHTPTQHILPKQVLITEYKNFICPYLDCEYILYDKAFNPSINHKIEPNQYNACIAITGAMNGSSRNQIYYLIATIQKHLNHIKDYA